MLRRAKILNIICSVTVSVVLVLILILGLVLGGVISFENNKLVIKSVSDQKVYDGVNSEGTYADNEPQQEERNVTPSDGNSGALDASFDPADELMPQADNNAGFDPFV